jgi:hypothetical protein
MTALIAMVVLGKEPMVSQAVLSGIVVTELRAPEGMVQVYLPADMMAGDTISGTVVAEPRGTGEERTKNEGVLNGYAIAVAGVPAVRSNATSSCWIRVSPLPSGGSPRIVLRSGEKEFSAPLLIEATADSVRPQFVIPEVSATGRPLTITGPFDGNAGTTSVSVGGKAAPVICESPRGAVVQPDASFIGKKSVTVDEAGATVEGTLFLPRLTLSATKTALIRGETATLTVRVDGLEGAPASIYPIPVELVNHSPQVIDLAARTNFGIGSDNVRGGVFTRTFRLTAIGSGSYNIAGLLYAVSLHNAKLAMSRTEFNDWLRALKLSFAERIKVLQAELAAKGGRDAGLEANIERKRKALNLLNDIGGATDAGQQARAIPLVDKVLADESFFSMAAELTSMAAEMLGYTDLPLPGIGTLLKGLKAIVKGTPRAVEALSEAQRLYDQIAALQSAEAKVDKAKEVQAALEKVREAVG